MPVNREEAIYGNGRAMRGSQGRMMANGRSADSYGRGSSDGRMGRGNNMQRGCGMGNDNGNLSRRSPQSGRGMQSGRGAAGHAMETAKECGCVTEAVMDCDCVTEVVTDCGCVTNETADCDCVDYSDIPAKNEAKLLAYIDEVSFCAYDVMLYLDTHPTDENAQEYFRKYSGKRNRAIDIYEEKYGPLRYGQTAMCGTGSVKWVTQSWPWEGGVC